MIRFERHEDHLAVGELHALAFGPGEPVPALVEALRPLKGCISLVAEEDGVVVGHVMLTVCRLDTWPRLVEVHSLSPLGVHPDYQRRGIGAALVARALQDSDGAGVPLVFLEGSPKYYGARGFERASTAGFRAPSVRIPDPAFQVAKLSAYEPWMTGSFVYAETFWALDCVGIRDVERFARISGL
jgi:putative acetyltransferase